MYKSRISAIFAALLALVGLMASASDAGLRLMSYNIRNGVGLDGRTDYKRIAHVIDSVSPDVVAIQEVDSVTGRSHGRDILAEIAGHAGMHHIYAPAISYDGGKYGIGILSKKKALGFYSVPLPGREEERTLLVAEFDDYLFCCTHLSLTEENRMASLPIIENIAAKCDKPFFIAGDMNSNPGDRFMTAFTEDFEVLSGLDGKTYPADKPEELIDYIAVGRRWADRVVVKNRSVANQPQASDHRPVVVNLMLKYDASKIISCYPYLQNPTDDAITVMWQTSVPCTGTVYYGTDPEHLRPVRTLLGGQSDWGRFHKVRLGGLLPGQKYFYRVVSREIMEYGAYHKVFGDSAQTGLSSFMLPETGRRDFTALVFNDIHQHMNTLDALYSKVADESFDFVVFNGDCIDDPDSYERAARVLDHMNRVVGADCKPVFHLRGNHEIRGAYSVGLRSFFDREGGKTYGTFNWGDTRFVLLDCGEDKPDSTYVYYGLNDFTDLRLEQREFLKNELKSKPFKKAGRKVLIHHVPVYGLEVDYTDYNPCQELWSDLLDKAPFDVALNAHTHRYAWHEAGAKGNPYPVVIGGGFDMEGATVMVLSRRGDELRLKVVNTKGEVLREESL